MTLRAYRTIGGLGGFPTGARLSTRQAWIDTDTTYCLRVVRLCELDCVKYQIDFADGKATLTVTETTGDTTGSATAIASGDTERITAGDFWVDVERVAVGFEGYLIARPIPCQNNEVAHSDTTDPSTLITYRCVFLYAPEALTVDSIVGVGVDVGVDTLGETTDTIADEETAPSGVVFAATWGVGQVMDEGEWLAVWIKRTANETTGEHSNTVTIGYTVGVTAYTMVLTGAYITSVAARTPYYLYYQIAAAGYQDQVYTISGITMESPVAISALPYLIDVGAVQDAMHAAGFDDIVLSAALRSAKDSGAESQNQLFDYVLVMNYSTGDGTKPNAPTIDTMTFLDGGQAQVVVDHDQAGAVTRAKRLYVTIGTETLRATLPLDVYSTTTTFIFQTASEWGASVTVTVYAQDSEERNSDSDTATETALWSYTGQPYGDVFPASRTYAAPSYDDLAAASWGDVDAVSAAGLSYISLDGVVVLDGRTEPDNMARLISLAIKGEDVSGVGVAAPIEPISATEFYLCANSTRVAKVDTVTGKLYCYMWKAGTPPQACPVNDVWAEYDGVVYWQVYDYALGIWKPWLCVDSNRNCLVFCLPLKTV